MKKIIFAIVALMFVGGCKQKAVKYLDEKTLIELHRICPRSENKTIILYDLDGDCSMCLAKMDFIAKKYKNVPDSVPIFIAETYNPEVFNFNIKKANISGCIYIDSAKTISKKFVEGQVWQIDIDRSITNRKDF